MESVELQIDPREAGRKGPSRRLRRVGKLPAVLYGPKRPPAPIAVDAKEFSTKVAAGRGSSLLVRLQSSSADIAGSLALVKDMQRHPITGDVVHADFYEVDMKAKLRVRVPLELTGRAAGIEFGGILQHVQREVEVLCLPADIPALIEVDVTNLNIHDSIHISEVQAPPGVEVQFDSDEPVATVLAPTVEEVKVEAAEGEEGAEGAGEDKEKKGASAEKAEAASAEPKTEEKA